MAKRCCLRCTGVQILVRIGIWLGLGPESHDEIITRLIAQAAATLNTVQPLHLCDPSRRHNTCFNPHPDPHPDRHPNLHPNPDLCRNHGECLLVLLYACRYPLDPLTIVLRPFETDATDPLFYSLQTAGSLWKRSLQYPTQRVYVSRPAPCVRGVSRCS